jgi:hypothetical protein
MHREHSTFSLLHRMHRGRATKARLARLASREWKQPVRSAVDAACRARQTCRRMRRPAPVGRGLSAARESKHRLVEMGRIVQQHSVWAAQVFDTERGGRAWHPYACRPGAFAPSRPRAKSRDGSQVWQELGSYHGGHFEHCPDFIDAHPPRLPGPFAARARARRGARRHPASPSSYNSLWDN